MRSGGGRGHRGHCRPGPGLCPCRKRTSWGPAGGQPPEAGGSRDCGAPSPGPSGAPHVRGSCWAVLPAAQPRLLREAVIALGLLPQVVVLHTLAHGPRAHLRNSACHPGPTPGRLASPRAWRCAVSAPPPAGTGPLLHTGSLPFAPDHAAASTSSPLVTGPAERRQQGQSPHPERTAHGPAARFCHECHRHPRGAVPAHGAPLRAAPGLTSLAPLAHERPKTRADVPPDAAWQRSPMERCGPCPPLEGSHSTAAATMQEHPAGPRTGQRPEPRRAWDPGGGAGHTRTAPYDRERATAPLGQRGAN